MAERRLRRGLQLVVSCAVLGVGVGLLLDARLGSDGYSMLVSGIALASGLDFWIPNLVVGVLLVLMAWLRGRAPGLGTLAQPLVVGTVVSWTLWLLDRASGAAWLSPYVESTAGRWLELLLGLVVLAAGVAGYLATELGAGPAEAAALAWDPPVPFRWSYSLVQLLGATVGWLLGASLGPGTVLVIVAIGPMVARLQPRLTAPGWREPLAHDGTDPEGPVPSYGRCEG
ncbi:hypothetical protein [Nocardioides sp.]|uniref:hypothetical protein n=1 Tax=Nocardioides sp. TaxID=35761 RepID=UPI0035660A92